MYVAGERYYLFPLLKHPNNLINNIHKKALKFTYDEKGNKLNDFVLPNMTAIIRAWSLVFTHLCLFDIFKYALMWAIFLHPNDHTVIEKATQIIRILFDDEILQF